MNHDDVVIVAAARTPQGRLKGQLAALTAVQLGSIAIRGALEQGGVPAEAVDAVLVGQVLAAGSGQNPARQAAVGAGIPWSVNSSHPSTRCASRGSPPIIDGARMIAVGDATVVVAAGMESMTRAPHLLMGSRDGWTYGSIEVLDHMAYDGLTDAFDRESMGASTERHNGELHITREMQDAVAARSHQRAAAATEAGVFDAEIVPVEIPQRKGDAGRGDQGRGDPPRHHRRDARGAAPGLRRGRHRSPRATRRRSPTAPRRSCSRPVRTPTRTAGPCSPSWARQVRSPGPDNSLHSQPARAIEKALAKQGIGVGRSRHRGDQRGIRRRRGPLPGGARPVG